MPNLGSRGRESLVAEFPRQWGFADVEVIDDDLGRSASGMVARPGFERLVAWLCAGKVGAVLCFDASRLARNGRDWRAPCKGGAFQWVQIPSGNRSSRKQSEQSWR